MRYFKRIMTGVLAAATTWSLAACTDQPTISDVGDVNKPEKEAVTEQDQSKNEIPNNAYEAPELPEEEPEESEEPRQPEVEPFQLGQLEYTETEGFQTYTLYDVVDLEDGYQVNVPVPSYDLYLQNEELSSSDKVKIFGKYSFDYSDYVPEKLFEQDETKDRMFFAYNLKTDAEDFKYHCNPARTYVSLSLGQDFVYPDDPEFLTEYLEGVVYDVEIDPNRDKTDSTPFLVYRDDQFAGVYTTSASGVGSILNSQTTFSVSKLIDDTQILTINFQVTVPFQTEDADSAEQIAEKRAAAEEYAKTMLNDALSVYGLTEFFQALQQNGSDSF